MKLKLGFKILLYTSLAILYFTGVYVWIRFLNTDSSPGTISILHLHSIVSLWFLMLFGYLWHSHILRGLKVRKKLKSGLLLLSTLIIMIATIPGLFYLTDEKWRANIALLHSYLGLLLLLPFLLHLILKKTISKSLKPRNSEDQSA